MVLSSYSLRTWRRKYQKKDKEDIFHHKLWTYYVSEVMRIKKPLIEANEAYNKASKAYNEVKKTYKEALEMSTGEDIEKNRLVKENLERMKTEQDKKADLSSTAATAFQKKLKDWKLPREGSERDAAYRQVYRDKKLNYNPPTRTPWSIDDIIAILHKLRTAKEKEEKDKIAAAEAVSEEVETEEEEEEEEEEEAFRGASEGSITATPLALALGLLDNSNRERRISWPWAMTTVTTMVMATAGFRTTRASRARRTRTTTTGATASLGHHGVHKGRLPNSFFVY